MIMGMVNFKLKNKLAEHSYDMSALDHEFREVKLC